MIVLDTHIFLWYILDEPMDNGLKELLARTAKEVLVPSVCFWEAVLLAEKGRIEMDAQNTGGALKRYMEDSGFQEAPLTSEMAVLSRTLAFEHNDPADRFIAATAYALNASLATEDQNLRKLSWLKLAH